MFTKDKLVKEIDELIFRSCTGISSDVKRLLERALDCETNSTAKRMLSAMLENVEIANERQMPVCQSPGLPTVYVNFGNLDVPESIKEIFQNSIVEATNNGLLRPSMVHPLTRENSGDNSGLGIPNFEFDYVPDQEYVDIIVSFKGCGAELGNAMQIMTTAQLGKNLSGLKKFILETIVNAGGKPCPPFGIGIGLGGQMDIASKLSRKAISTRRWDDENPNPLYAELEKELLEEINRFGIGAAGTGGDTAALAVKISGVSTHTAIAPVAINFHCWVARRAGVRLFPDGSREIIF